MLKNLAICLINSDKGLLDEALLKKANNSKELGSETEDILFLEKTLRMHGDKCDFFIAKLGEDEVVGYILGRKFDDYNLYRSAGIHVAKKYRHMGIGTELTRAQIELAKKYGCSYISMSTAKKNKACMKILERLGFSLTIYEDGGCSASLNLKPEKK